MDRVAVRSQAGQGATPVAHYRRGPEVRDDGPMRGAVSGADGARPRTRRTRPGRRAAVLSVLFGWAVTALGLRPYPGAALPRRRAPHRATPPGAVRLLWDHPRVAGRRRCPGTPTPSRSSSARSRPLRPARGTARSPRTSTCPWTPFGPGYVGSPDTPNRCASPRPDGRTPSTPNSSRSSPPAQRWVMPSPRSRNLDWVAAEINDRPRKRLAFKKPIELIGDLLLR